MKVVIGYEGHTTGDNRTILPGALTWEELPLPIFSLSNDVPYDIRKVVGQITELERVGNEVIATMSIDMPEGYVLSLDGADSVIDYEYRGADDSHPHIIFTSMRIAGGTLIPEEKWAWKND